MDVRYLWDLVRTLTATQIKVRYKQTFLGYLWSLGNPLAFAWIFVVVLQEIMRFRFPNYGLFLICGLFPWQWISNTLIGSTTVVVSNGSIIKKVNFPRAVLPLALVLQDGFHFLMSIPITLGFLLANGQFPDQNWIIGVPLFLVLQGVLLYGWAMILGAVNMFLRDVENIVGILMMLLFYGTPILYSSDMVPKDFAWLTALNPFAMPVILWRDLFLKNLIDWGEVARFAGVAFGWWVVGMWVFNRLSRRFAELL